MSRPPIRIASRKSDLALWQANYVADRIRRELGAPVEILSMKTTGDRLAGSLSKVGGKGLFVKEIQEALLEGRADLAVHSSKDLPARSLPELALCAVPEREDPRDALVAREAGATLRSLPKGARVGTGSVRRSAQLLRLRPDLEIVPLRGNVPTRMRKIEEDGLDGVILASAGLSRLGLAEHISERISPDDLLPSVGQGALALEARKGDPVAEELAALSHAPSAARLSAERAFQAAIGGDCSVPLASYAELLPGGALRVRALVISIDGEQIAAGDAEVPVDEAVAAGERLAIEVLEGGGREILAALPEENSIS